MIPLRDDNPATSTPLVTLAIIIACVAIYFLVQPPTGSPDEDDFLFERAAIPCEVLNGAPLSNDLSRAECDGEVVALGVPDAEEYFPGKQVYLALLFSMFLHGGILHLGGNMLFLWIFGNNVEDRLGHVGYVVFYLVAGVLASLAHVFTQTTSTTPVIGASGAIAGVMGAYLVFFPHARVLTLVPLFVFIQFLHLPAVVVLVGWFLLQFLTGPDTGVATMAHIGGFVVGAVVALTLRPLLGRSTPTPPPGYRYDPG